MNGGRNGTRTDSAQGSPWCAAVDLGAESGRVVLGRIGPEGLEIEEVHRFPNRPLRLPSGLHWNVGALFEQMLDGLRLSVERAGGSLGSVGVDAWAVDFALLDRDGALVGLPHHYRDRRTEGAVADLCEAIPAAELYSQTGIQFMPINTSCQLLRMAGSPQLEAAETLLMIPDLFAYWLSGRAASERTVASTTQLLGVDGHWIRSVLPRLGLTDGILPEVVEAGTRLGPVRSKLGIGGGELPVTAVASHDTASAVVAVPAPAGDIAFVSSGTWSLVGLEVDQPRTGALARDLNISNEVGFGGTVRLLTNVMGLWLLQECRRAWAREGLDLDYQALIAMAAESDPGPLVDPDLPQFLTPGDMPARIHEACLAGGQSPPVGPAALARCILESLACKYRLALERVERVAGRRAEVVHVVGGGARNPLLCQLTADILDRPVHAGPVEATAIGNLMVQQLSLGTVRSLAEARQAVAAASAPEVYHPSEQRPRNDRIWARFSAVLDRGSAALPRPQDLTAT